MLYASPLAEVVRKCCQAFAKVWHEESLSLFHITPSDLLDVN